MFTFGLASHTMRCQNIATVWRCNSQSSHLTITNSTFQHFTGLGAQQLSQKLCSCVVWEHHKLLSGPHPVVQDSKIHYVYTQSLLSHLDKARIKNQAFMHVKDQY